MSLFKKNSAKQRRYTSFQLGLPKEVNTLLGVSLVAAFFILRGSLFLLSPQLAQLECDRPKPELGICRLVLSGLWQEQVLLLPVDQIAQADVRWQGRSRQLVLRTADRIIPFPTNYGFGSTTQVADQINTFLQSDAASLQLTQDNRGWVYPLGVVLIAFGSVLLYLSWLGYHHRPHTPKNRLRQ